MKWASITNVGSRMINEDSVGIIEQDGSICFVVADGLGGHGKGDVASRLAVETFEKEFKNTEQPVEKRIDDAFMNTNQVIIDEQKKDYAQMQMKTTAVALVTHEDSVFWGHIGDSRLYAFTFWGVKERTIDHSVPQMLVLSKEIREKEIRNHPDRNKLLRVLGVAGTAPRFDVSEKKEMKKYKAFLLCTDGFWELILEKEMTACLRKAKSPEEWLAKMETIVRKRGEGIEMDNYSAIGVII